MKCIILAIVFLVIAGIVPLEAQPVKDYTIYNFNNDNGLPQNSVKAIALDKDNYLWVATESGIVRYDGRNFRHINKNNIHSLSPSRITNVGVMHNGHIYFTDDNSNIYLQGNKGNFNKLAEKINSDLFINLKTGLYNPAEHLGIAGLNYLRSQYIDNWTNNIQFLPSGDTANGYISINKSTLAYVAGKKVQWIDSLQRYNRHVQHGCGVLAGQFYYLNLDYGIGSIDSTGRHHPVALRGIVPDTGKPLPGSYSLLQQENSLYLLYANRVYRLQQAGPEQLQATLLLEVGNIPNITCFREYQGINTYAVGSNTRGLFLFKRKQFRVLSFAETDNIFYTQAPYRDSGVLTQFGVLFPHSTLKLPFDKIKRQSILKDREGYYWLNQGANSILKVDADFRVLRTIKLNDLYVVAFAQAPDGHIWFITNKNKLGKITPEGIEWLSLKLRPNSLRCLLPIDEENFWIAGNKNLSRINVRTRQVVRYNYFNDCEVRFLRLDEEGVLWIGTYGKGLFALKGKTLIRLPQDNKGTISFVHALLKDKKGNIWLSTNNGLLRTPQKELKDYIDGRSASVYYQHYTKELGFNTNEFNGGCTPAALELKDGRLSFPSMDGLVQFYPDSIENIYPTSEIFIDDLIIDGKVSPVKNGALLPPSFNRMEVMLSSPYYDNPSNQQIEYKLKNFDNDWYPLGANNTIVYNRLPYGAYELLFRKRAGTGDRGFITCSLRFTVKPFFYQKWYFKALAALLLTLLLLLFFRLRYFYLIKKQRKLEHKVQQRTRELVYNNRLKEKLTLLIAHDLQSPLHFLSILSRHVHKAALNNDIKSVLDGSEEIKNTTSKIYSFVQEFSLWNMSLNDNYKLNKTTFPINDLIGELKQFFEEMLRLKHNTLLIQLDKQISVHTDRDVLKAILRNVIDNANKYTQDGTITVTALRNGDNTLELSVADTGNGMSEEQLEALNYRILQSPSIPAIERDGRLGFQLIIDFAARMEARLKVSSESGKGTTITISGIACGL